MIFSILGFQKGKDELVYEREIGLSVSDLMPIMHWSKSDDCIGADFKISPDQAAEISALETINLPAELDLYLTGYE